MKKHNLFQVYVIVNLNELNRIVYVGQTSDFNKRKAKHLSPNTPSDIAQYIKEVGKENIEIYPVKTYKRKDFALKYDEKLILQCNTMFPNGLNKHHSTGGDDEKAAKRKQITDWHKKNRQGKDEWNEKHNEHQKKYLERKKLKLGLV